MRGLAELDTGDRTPDGSPKFARWRASRVFRSTPAIDVIAHPHTILARGRRRTHGLLRLKAQTARRPPDGTLVPRPGRLPARALQAGGAASVRAGVFAPARDDFGARVLSAPASLPAGAGARARAGSRAVRPPRARRGGLLLPPPLARRRASAPGASSSGAAPLREAASRAQPGRDARGMAGDSRRRQGAGLHEASRGDPHRAHA